MYFLLVTDWYQSITIDFIDRSLIRINKVIIIIIIIIIIIVIIIIIIIIIISVTFR